MIVKIFSCVVLFLLFARQTDMFLYSWIALNACQLLGETCWEQHSVMIFVCGGVCTCVGS